MLKRRLIFIKPAIKDAIYHNHLLLALKAADAFCARKYGNPIQLNHTNQIESLKKNHNNVKIAI